MMGDCVLVTFSVTRVELAILALMACLIILFMVDSSFWFIAVLFCFMCLIFIMVLFVVAVFLDLVLLLVVLALMVTVFLVVNV